MTHEHFEVNWTVHYSKDESRPKRSVKLSTLELARREMARIVARNDLYVQDEDGYPFIDGVKILRVYTSIEHETVERAVDGQGY